MHLGQILSLLVASFTLSFSLPNISEVKHQEVLAETSPEEIHNTPTPQINTFDIQDVMIEEVNSFRRIYQKDPIQKDTYTCDFAKIRSLEISSDFTHKGFDDRVTKKSLPYPSYSKINENIAMNSDYKKVVATWISSPPHAANLLDDITKGCISKNGNYYVFLGWNP